MNRKGTRRHEDRAGVGWSVGIYIQAKNQYRLGYLAKDRWDNVNIP